MVVGLFVAGGPQQEVSCVEVRDGLHGGGLYVLVWLVWLYRLGVVISIFIDMCEKLIQQLLL